MKKEIEMYRIRNPFCWFHNWIEDIFPELEKPLYKRKEICNKCGSEKLIFNNPEYLITNLMIYDNK